MSASTTVTPILNFADTIRTRPFGCYTWQEVDIHDADGEICGLLIHHPMGTYGSWELDLPRVNGRQRRDAATAWITALPDNLRVLGSDLVDAKRSVGELYRSAHV